MIYVPRTYFSSAWLIADDNDAMAREGPFSVFMLIRFAIHPKEDAYRLREAKRNIVIARIKEDGHFFMWSD